MASSDQFGKLDNGHSEKTGKAKEFQVTINLRSAIAAASALVIASLLTLSAQAQEKPQILSAFHGADDRRAVRAMQSCNLPLNQTVDGMPLVFSVEIEQSTLDPGDVRVVLSDGREVTPICATTGPASEENEDRTVLVAGDFGQASGVVPVSVEIAGDLLGEAPGGGTVQLKGLKVSVTPFDAGPSILIAEMIRSDELELEKTSQRMGESCPAPATRQAIRLIWSGGVTNNNRELNLPQLRFYEVQIVGADGKTEWIKPDAMGDLNDWDNNQDLCVDRDGTPKAVRVAADTVSDPAGHWNEEQEIVVIGGDR